CIFAVEPSFLPYRHERYVVVAMPTALVTGHTNRFGLFALNESHCKLFAQCQILSKEAFTK
ncbi:MAG TPA: hypothetical protein VGB17_14280, partial [Pyrinomonadaceae bacterium]